MGLFLITTLAKAASKGRTDLVTKFVAEGQDPNKFDSLGLTPLQHAVNKGHLEIVKFLVEKADADIDRRKKGGFNALMYAVFGNHHEIAAYLLNSGVLVNCSADEYSPIHYLIMNDKKPWAKEILELMLRNGANPNCIDKLNQTPLEHALSRKNLEIMKILVTFGADVVKEDKQGFSLLHQVITAKEFSLKDRLAMVDVILKTGIDPNLHARDGSTPLHMAARLTDKQGLEMANLLIEHGADPNVIDSAGHTPSDTAGQKGHPKTQSLLNDCLCS